MDPRIQAHIMSLIIKKNLLGRFYLVSNMGSSNFFLGKEDALLKTIEASGVDKVAVFHHTLCKAYESFNPEEEKKIQFKDMEKTEEIINSNFPEIEVIKVWLTLDVDTGQVISSEKIPQGITAI
jgi:carbonic anhydrase